MKETELLSEETIQVSKRNFCQGSHVQKDKRLTEASFCRCIFLHARSSPSRIEVDSFFFLCVVHWLLRAVRRF